MELPKGLRVFAWCPLLRLDGEINLHLYVGAPEKQKIVVYAGFTRRHI